MRKVSWWVPRWSFARRLIWQLRAELRKLSWAWIVVWSLIGSAVICVLIKAKYPDLDLAVLWRMPFAVVGMFVLLGFQGGLLPILVPPHIVVAHDKIRYSHGESGWVAKHDECTSFKLIVFAPRFRRLIFQFKGKRRSVGLAESVDIFELRSLLPYPLKMVEAQKRFAFFQRGRYVL